MLTFSAYSCYSSVIFCSCKDFNWLVSCSNLSDSSFLRLCTANTSDCRCWFSAVLAASSSLVDSSSDLSALTSLSCSVAALLVASACYFCSASKSVYSLAISLPASVSFRLCSVSRASLSCWAFAWSSRSLRSKLLWLSRSLASSRLRVFFSYTNASRSRANVCCSYLRSLSIA